MGVIADYLAASAVIDHALPIDTLDRRAYRELQALVHEGDFVLPSVCRAVNEVQEIAVYEGTVDGGTFTLEFDLASGETFTTAAIAYNADAAIIESAIDTAATLAGIEGWTNGDISVSGGDLTSDPVVLTYDGDSVKEQNHGLVVMDDSLLTGGGSGGEIEATTEGQADRLGYGVLVGLGIVTGTLPAEGDIPTLLTQGAVVGQRRLSAETIRAIALDIAMAEGENSQAMYDAICTAAGV
jgi:hypothetical protein